MQGKGLAICCRPENYNDFLEIGKRIIKKAPEIAVAIKPASYHPDELDPALKYFPLLKIIGNKNKKTLLSLPFTNFLIVAKNSSLCSIK